MAQINNPTPVCTLTKRKSHKHPTNNKHYVLRVSADVLAIADAVRCGLQIRYFCSSVCFSVVCCHSVWFFLCVLSFLMRRAWVHNFADDTILKKKIYVTHKSHSHNGMMAKCLCLPWFASCVSIFFRRRNFLTRSVTIQHRQREYTNNKQRCVTHTVCSVIKNDLFR